MSRPIIYQDSLLGFAIEVRAKPARKSYTYKNSRRVARVLHLGAGIQSSAMAEMMVEGELEPVDFVIFDDTGNEPPWVHEQVDYLERRLATVSIPLYRVKKANSAGIIGDLMSPTNHFGALPFWTVDPATGKKGRTKRQCTSNYKIQPSDDCIRDWFVEHGYASIHITKKGVKRRIVKRRIYVESLFGISYDEIERAGSRGASWQKACYPLIERRMTRADCVR